MSLTMAPPLPEDWKIPFVLLYLGLLIVWIYGKTTRQEF